MIKSEKLINDLNALVQQHIQYSKSLLNLPEKSLQFRLNNNSWCVLECLEHLNLYGDFYLIEIKKRITTSKSKKNTSFKTGFLGNKFALDMLPKEQMKTMNTFKSKNPIHSNLSKEKVLLKFIQQQEEMQNLLTLALEKDLNKIKTSITLPLLKFKLGDTFRFVIYHNERHIVQAKKVLENL